MTIWDDSAADDSAAVYSTSYLMPPPETMIASHLPKLINWQLLSQPKNQKAFEQTPLLTPQFFAEDLTLLSPDTYQTKVENKAEINIKHPPNYPSKLVAQFIQQKDDTFSIWDWS
ncbi:MAG: hypothetical protein AAGC54_13245, partial [Cyanobacteria bacterium P01_F01_bin.4]